MFNALPLKFSALQAILKGWQAFSPGLAHQRLPWVNRKTAPTLKGLKPALLPRLIALLALIGIAALRADDFRPDASGVPIIQVYPLITNSSNNVSIDHAHLLLSVDKVSDIFLKKDQRRVRLVLTAADARAFAAILRKFDGVGITAGDKVALISGYTGFNGSLTFDNPVAAYLRQRFHVKPGTNQVDAPPVNPFAMPNP
jgi:hypothetical protein